MRPARLKASSARSIPSGHAHGPKRQARPGQIEGAFPTRLDADRRPHLLLSLLDARRLEGQEGLGMDPECNRSAPRLRRLACHLQGLHAVAQRLAHLAIQQMQLGAKSLKGAAVERGADLVAELEAALQVGRGPGPASRYPCPRQPCARYLRNTSPALSQSARASSNAGTARSRSPCQPRTTP